VNTLAARWHSRAACSTSSSTRCAEAQNAAQYRHRWSRRRVSTPGRLGRGDGKRRLACVRALRAGLPVGPHRISGRSHCCFGADYRNAAVPMLPGIIGTARTHRRILPVPAALITASLLPGSPSHRLHRRRRTARGCYLALAGGLAPKASSHAAAVLFHYSLRLPCTDLSWWRGHRGGAGLAREGRPSSGQFPLERGFTQFWVEGRKPLPQAGRWTIPENFLDFRQATQASLLWWRRLPPWYALWGTHEGVRPLPEEIRDVIDTIGVSYRPEDMDHLDDVGAALRRLPAHGHRRRSLVPVAIRPSRDGCVYRGRALLGGERRWANRSVCPDNDVR